MKFKKTSAALLVATLAVTGSSYAWANETLFQPNEESTEEATVGSSNLISVTTEDSATVNTSTEDTATVSNDDTTTDTAFPEIPEGYPSSNLVALKQAYENAGNATAKAAILRNAKRAIEKFEARQETLKEEETTVVEVNEEVVEETQTEEQKATEQPTTEAPVVEKSTKEERKALQAEQKAERKALQVEHKAEKQILKEQQKETKASNKENK